MSSVVTKGMDSDGLQPENVSLTFYTSFTQFYFYPESTTDRSLK